MRGCLRLCAGATYGVDKKELCEEGFCFNEPLTTVMISDKCFHQKSNRLRMMSRSKKDLIGIM